MTERRAVEAVVWGMPAVNFELMVRAFEEMHGGWNQVVYWSRLADWKNQTLTPNPDTVYLMPFYNTKDAGPMVLEIPPAGAGESITGSGSTAPRRRCSTRPGGWGTSRRAMGSAWRGRRTRYTPVQLRRHP